MTSIQLILRGHEHSMTDAFSRAIDDINDYNKASTKACVHNHFDRLFSHMIESDLRNLMKAAISGYYELSTEYDPSAIHFNEKDFFINRVLPLVLLNPEVKTEMTALQRAVINKGYTLKEAAVMLTDELYGIYVRNLPRSFDRTNVYVKSLNVSPRQFQKIQNATTANMFAELFSSLI